MSTTTVGLPHWSELARLAQASANQKLSPAADLARLEAAIRAGRPICQVCSPLGFSQITQFWQELVLYPMLIEMGVEPMYNWRYRFDRLINAPVGDESREVSSQLALLHLDAVECCDFIIAILDQEPPDNGTVVELAHAASFGVPCISFRHDLRSASGEAGNPFNLMIMGAVQKSGGFHVRSLEELAESLPSFLQTLDPQPRLEAFRRWMNARSLFEEGILLPVP